MTASQPLYNNYSYNVSGLILNQKYAFKHFSTNNYGTMKSNSSSILIQLGFTPKVIGNHNISYSGMNVKIDFYYTFNTSSYSMNSFEVLFLSSSNNWYELPIYCSPGLSSLLYYRYCSIPMEAFSDYPLFLESDDKI